MLLRTPSCTSSSSSCSARSATIAASPSVLTLKSQEEPPKSWSKSSLSQKSSTQKRKTSSPPTNTASQWQQSQPNFNFNLNYKHHSLSNRSVKPKTTSSHNQIVGKAFSRNTIIPNVHYSLNSAFSSVMMATAASTSHSDHHSIRSNSIRYLVIPLINPFELLFEYHKLHLFIAL